MGLLDKLEKEMEAKIEARMGPIVAEMQNLEGVIKELTKAVKENTRVRKEK